MGWRTRTDRVEWRPGWRVALSTTVLIAIATRTGWTVQLDLLELASLLLADLLVLLMLRSPAGGSAVWPLRAQTEIRTEGGTATPARAWTAVERTTTRER